MYDKDRDPQRDENDPTPRAEWIETRAAELYEDLENGRDLQHLAQMLCEVVDADMAEKIRLLVLCCHGVEDYFVRDRAMKLWGDLQSEMTDYSLRIAEYEADHPTKEEV